MDGTRLEKVGTSKSTGKEKQLVNACVCLSVYMNTPSKETLDVLAHLTSSISVGTHALMQHSHTHTVYAHSTCH